MTAKSWAESIRLFAEGKDGNYDEGHFQCRGDNITYERIFMAFRDRKGGGLVSNDRWGVETGTNTARRVREEFTKAGIKFGTTSANAISRGSINMGTVEIIDSDANGQALFTAETSDAWRRGIRVPFINGYDPQEDPPLYFLSELPYHSDTIEGALLSLKPPSVLIAERDGRAVVRQGDMFAIPFVLEVPEDAVTEYTGEGTGTNRGRPLYGTAHSATFVAVLENGTHLAKGELIHDPMIIRDNRQADHARRPLGDGNTWHLTVRNTVPTSGQREVSPARQAVLDRMQELGVA